MDKLKINILYPFHKGPWGGGNQFLKALRMELINRGVYEEEIDKANCILFNAFHNLDKVLIYKSLYPRKVFIHRIDGPTYLIRGKDIKIDHKIYKINDLIADGTVFQSDFSRRMNFRLGMMVKSFYTIIMNAPNPEIFFPLWEKSKKKDLLFSKCSLIASSWSENINKGFKLYKYLDENLNFDKYSMTFVGNSPIEYKNIKHIKPVKPKKLSEIYQKSDIYITGSKNDPCSNSLIEAIACGLPSIGLNSGGHPEIIKRGGELFNNYSECLKKIELIKTDYYYYRNKINMINLNEITDMYVKFISKVYSIKITKNKIKRLNLIKLLKGFLFINIIFADSIKDILFNSMFFILILLRQLSGIFNLNKCNKIR